MKIFVDKDRSTGYSAVVLKPFHTPADPYTHSYYGAPKAELMGDDDDGVQTKGKAQMLIMAELVRKACKKFGLSKPRDSVSLGWISMLSLADVTPDQEYETDDTVVTPALELLELKDPGVCWWVAGMIEMAGAGAATAILQHCSWVGPLDMLLLLSATKDVDVNIHGAGKPWLPKPCFDDLDMLATLKKLPAITCIRFSNAVYAALVSWGFALSVEYILKCSVTANAGEHETRQSRMKLFHGVTEAFDAISPNLRALHGLLAPGKIDFSKLEFTSEFSESVVRMSHILEIECLSRDGTPLNNPDFAEWVSKNPDKILSKTEGNAHYHRITPDGLILNTLKLIHEGKPGHELLAPLQVYTKDRGSSDSTVTIGGMAIAALLGSAALTSEQRTQYLTALFTDDNLLDKLATSRNTPDEGGTPAPVRMIEVEVPLIKKYATAPVRMANLGAWLGRRRLGLDFKGAPEATAELPRLVRKRLAEQNEKRAQGYSNWINWLTEEKK